MTAALVTMLVVMVGVLVLGAGKPELIPSRISAGEFVLVDEHGKERAALRMVTEDQGTVDGPYLILTDSAERPRVRLGLTEVSSGGETIELEMSDAAGVSQLAMKYMDNGLENTSILSVRHGMRSQIYLIADPGDARIQVKNYVGRHASGVQVFSTPHSHGLVLEGFKSLGGGEGLLHPEIRLVREKDENRISIHDDEGEPVWVKP